MGKKGVFVAILILVCLALPVCGGDAPYIYGHVSDADTGAMIPDAYISSSTVNTTTQTDATGYYTLSLPSGSQTIRAYHGGYQGQSKEVYVAGSTQVDFTMDSLLFDNATEHVETLNNSAYQAFDSGVFDFSWSDSVSALSMPYTAVLGNFFFLLLFLSPFMMAWLRQESVIIPLVWGFLLGGILTAFLPKEYIWPAYLMLILAAVGVLYKVFKERT